MFRYDCIEKTRTNIKKKKKNHYSDVLVSEGQQFNSLNCFKESEDEIILSVFRYQGGIVFM